jgi:hypothetical protein
MPTTEQIFPEYIRLDGGTQPREKIDQAVCDDYGERMNAGEPFPAIDVFFDGQDYWLVDGFHRVQAYVMAMPGKAIICNVYQGTLQDAQWYSYGVNKTHGLRRSNEDKKRAVKFALAHPTAEGKSNIQIADHCGVSEFMIRKYLRRKEDTSSSIISKMRQVNRGGTTYQQNATHIGKNPKNGKAKRKKQGKCIAPDAVAPVLGHSLPNPMIALNLPPNNPVIAAATIFKLFETDFVRSLVAELTQRLKGIEQ